MATVAVFVALGGSSYSALTVTGRNVPKDALTGADIKDLTGRDVTNNSLTGQDIKGLAGADIADGTLRLNDFAAGQVPKDGPQGPQGPRGPAGAPAAVVFAHISWWPDTPPPFKVEYGRGVIGVTNAATVGEATVTFAQSVRGCALLATGGTAFPSGNSDEHPSDVSTFMAPDGKSATVRMNNSSTGAAADGPFTIAALC